jgi:hypothetical protein
MNVQVFFGRSMNEERLIKVRRCLLSFCICFLLSENELWFMHHPRQSANYVRTELPVRIAHRLRDLQSLPYVVVTEEGVAKVCFPHPKWFLVLDCQCRVALRSMKSVLFHSTSFLA